MSDDDGNIKPEWSIRYSDLEFGQMVGKGNFGKVYRGDYLGTDVAIKELLLADDEEENKKYTEREVSMLTGVRHPNVVNFMGVAKRIKKGNEIFYIVTEWLPGGNLRKLIKDTTSPLSWRRRIEFARDTAIAMNYLHQKQIIHRDLKSANLMLAADGSLKVCDFGLARRKNTKKSGLMTMAGTEEWMAPEIIVGDEYDEKCDVFSFGVVMYELITREKPLPRGPATFFEFNLKEWNRRVPRDCPAPFSELALKCVDYYGKNRPSFADIVKHLKALLKSDLIPSEPKDAPSPTPVLTKSDERTREDVKQNLKKRLQDAEEQLKEDREQDDPKDPSVKNLKDSKEPAGGKNLKDSKDIAKSGGGVGGSPRAGEKDSGERKKKKKKKSAGKEGAAGGKSSTPTKKKKRDGYEEKTAEALLSKYYPGSKLISNQEQEIRRKEKEKHWQSEKKPAGRDNGKKDELVRKKEELAKKKDNGRAKTKHV